MAYLWPDKAFLWCIRLHYGISVYLLSHWTIELCCWLVIGWRVCWRCCFHFIVKEKLIKSTYFCSKHTKSISIVDITGVSKKFTISDHSSSLLTILISYLFSDIAKQSEKYLTENRLLLKNGKGNFWWKSKLIHILIWPVL